jgi:UDP-glucose 4,6-dehydratase
MDAPTLVYGAGWMGRQFAERLAGARLTRTDIADADAVSRELDAVGPGRVINCAGKTGRPNVDALEDRPGSTYRSNVVGPIVLATACRERAIHLTHLSSGCLYSGDNGGRGFGEEDPPNFAGSLYARTKALAEAALRDFDALQLRVRLPLSSVPSERNLLTKLLAFDVVVSTPNSVTVLDDFWGPAVALIERGATGVWNMVNDGLETHDTLLALYRERVDPDIVFDVVPATELGERLVAGRSNCMLSTAKLHAAGLALPPLATSLPCVVDGYGARQASTP